MIGGVFARYCPTAHFVLDFTARFYFTFIDVGLATAESRNQSQVLARPLLSLVDAGPATDERRKAQKTSNSHKHEEPDLY